jgi:hypothetical protein
LVVLGGGCSRALCWPASGVVVPSPLSAPSIGLLRRTFVGAVIFSACSGSREVGLIPTWGVAVDEQRGPPPSCYQRWLALFRRAGMLNGYADGSHGCSFLLPRSAVAEEVGLLQFSPMDFLSVPCVVSEGFSASVALRWFRWTVRPRLRCAVRLLCGSSHSRRVRVLVNLSRCRLDYVIPFDIACGIVVVSRTRWRVAFRVRLLVLQRGLGSTSPFGCAASIEVPWFGLG